MAHLETIPEPLPELSRDLPDRRFESFECSGFDFEGSGASPGVPGPVKNQSKIVPKKFQDVMGAPEPLPGRFLRVFRRVQGRPETALTPQDRIRSVQKSQKSSRGRFKKPPS